MTATPFTATITGSPRIGPKRELKRATESYWAGTTSRSELEKVAATIRHDTWAQLAAAGLDSVPVNTFSYYDQMLDTAVLLGALPRTRAGRLRRPGPLLRRRSWQRRHRAAGDDQVVRHQLPLHRPGDRPEHRVLAAPGKGAVGAQRGSRPRYSGPSGHHRPDHLPAAEQGGRRRGRTDRAARRADSPVQRAARPAGRQGRGSGCRSTSRHW